MAQRLVASTCRRPWVRTLRASVPLPVILFLTRAFRTVGQALQNVAHMPIPLLSPTHPSRDNPSRRPSTVLFPSQLEVGSNEKAGTNIHGSTQDYLIISSARSHSVDPASHGTPKASARRPSVDVAGGRNRRPSDVTYLSINAMPSSPSRASSSAAQDGGGKVYHRPSFSPAVTTAGLMPSMAAAAAAAAITPARRPSMNTNRNEHYNTGPVLSESPHKRKSVTQMTEDSPIPLRYDSQEAQGTVRYTPLMLSK